MKKQRIWVTTKRDGSGKYLVRANGKPTKYLIYRNDAAEPSIRWLVESEDVYHSLHETSAKRYCVEWIEKRLNGGKSR